MKLHIAYVGICGSDIQRLDMGQSLVSLGHEVIGTHDGTFYAVNPLLPCGNCDHCLAGETRFCAELTSLGKNGSGGFAGGDINMPLKNLVRLDENEKAYVLADPAACIVHAASLLTATPGQTILIIGDGTMALLFVELLIQRGIAVVQAVKRKSRYERAHPHATVITFDSLASNTYDSVVVCVGGTRATVLNKAAHAVKAGGTLLVVGAYHYLEDALDIKTLLKKEVAVKGSFSYEPHDFDEAITVIHNNINFFKGMMTDIFPSSKLDNAVQHHRTSDSRRKVVVSYQEE